MQIKIIYCNSGGKKWYRTCSMRSYLEEVTEFQGQRKIHVGIQEEISQLQKGFYSLLAKTD